MAKKKTKKRTRKKFNLWSPSIVGAIYFDKKGNWWVYDEDQRSLFGASMPVRGNTASVIPRSFQKDKTRSEYRTLKALV